MGVERVYPPRKTSPYSKGVEKKSLSAAMLSGVKQRSAEAYLTFKKTTGITTPILLKTTGFFVLNFFMSLYFSPKNTEAAQLLPDQPSTYYEKILNFTHSLGQPSQKEFVVNCTWTVTLSLAIVFLIQIITHNSRKSDERARIVEGLQKASDSIEEALSYKDVVEYQEKAAEILQRSYFPLRRKLWDLDDGPLVKWVSRITNIHKDTEYKTACDKLNECQNKIHANLYKKNPNLLQYFKDHEVAYQALRTAVMALIKKYGDKYEGDKQIDDFLRTRNIRL